MDHGLITQDPIQAGTPVPDQRGVGPHAFKPTARPEPQAPGNTPYEDHNLAPPSDPARDPEMGIPIGTEVPPQGQLGAEAPASRIPGPSGPDFRLGSGAARFLAGVRTALRYLPLCILEHFLILPYSAFYSHRTLGAYISLRLARPRWRIALLACLVVQAVSIGISIAGVDDLSGNPTIIQACGSCRRVKEGYPLRHLTHLTKQHRS